MRPSCLTGWEGRLSSSLGVRFWLDSAVCAVSRKDG
nr:MAG TPA: hypothetical protein [Caudoviricetes sp.]